MSGFWRQWLNIWCGTVGAFGLVLLAAGLPETEGVVRQLLGIMSGTAPPAMTDPLRFTAALLGAVTLGWSVTLFAAFRAADLLGESAAPIWRLLTVAVFGWYVIDSLFSVATGFALNAASNTVFLAAYLLAVVRSGVLGVSSTRAAARAR